MELYSFVWIGRYNQKKETVSPTASAGIAEHSLTESTTEESQRVKLIDEAVRTREITVEQDLVEDPLSEEWRDHALDYDYQSCTVVPLVYEETLQGILHLATDRPQGFDAGEREPLEELGITIASSVAPVTDGDDRCWSRPLSVCA